MKGRVVILDRLGDRLAAALLVDGALDDLLVAPPDDMPVPRLHMLMPCPPALRQSIVLQSLEIAPRTSRGSGTWA